MGFIKALALLLVIPFFGFLVSQWIISGYNETLVEEGVEQTIDQICVPEILSELPDLIPWCDEYAQVLWMQTGSIVSTVIAIILLLSFILFASLAGKNRTKIAKIFPPLIFVTLIILAILVVVQGAILTYGAYIAESYAVGRVHFILIGGIGLGALVGSLSLISSSFKLAKKQTHFVLGKKLDPQSHPKIFTLIKEISETLGARIPEHVVVGLEPNFYVTSADVNVTGDNSVLMGETLYLSLPLARILTIEEIKGIIGHELGHFRGEDTYYSLKFSPVYSGLTHAVTAMSLDENEGGAGTIATLPAFVVLSYIIDVFHRNVSSVSREREFEADKAASEVAPPKALASSLLKISLYANAWNELENRVIERLRVGKITRNLSLLFSSVVKYDVNEETISEVIDSIAQQTISHPTDSHPPTASRITELGLNIDDIEHDLLTFPGSACIGLFENPIEIEEELTTLQQQYFVALGVQVPDKDKSNIGATISAALGAHMVVADGKIESEEIDKAESIGISLSSDFDYIQFREYCHYPDSIPALDDLLESSTDIPSEGKSIIFDYLNEIAGSDGDISPEENQLLDQVRSKFELLT
jgi:Zn-dependent protease with chaperone function